MTGKTSKKICAGVLAFAIAASAAAGAEPVSAGAKTVTKKAEIAKVQKKLTGVKDKKYTYYLSYKKLTDRKLVRTDGKKTKTLKKGVQSFWIKGKYIYYQLSGYGFYRMKKNGTGKKKIATGVMHFLGFHDNYIYFKSIYGYKLSRAACDGSEQQFLLSHAKSGTAMIISNRIYYVTSKTVQTAENELQQKTVYSMKLDGTDLQKEYEAPAGMSLTIRNRNERLIIFDEQTAHLRQDNGTYQTIETTDLTAEDANIETMGKELLFVQYGKDSAADGMLYILGAQYYLYDDNLSKKLILDIDKSGVRAVMAGEEHTLSKIKQYYVIDSYNDQSCDGIYIFDKNGKFIRKISTVKVGEDNSYSYVIKNHTLYLSIYNVKKSRYDFETYKLK